MFRYAFALPLLLAAAILPGCDQDDVDPVTLVEPDDEEIRTAVQRARETTDHFLDLMENPPAEDAAFSVKREFREGEVSEYMWLTDVSFVDGQFVGKLDNLPRHISNVEVGEEYPVSRDEIADWMVFVDGRIHGAFTMRVLLDQLPEEKRQEIQASLVPLPEGAATTQPSAPASATD